MNAVKPHEVTDHANSLLCPCLVAGYPCCPTPHQDGSERATIFVHARNVARARRCDGHP